MTGVAGADCDPLGNGVALHQGERPFVDPFDTQDNHPLCLGDLVGGLLPGEASLGLPDGLAGVVAHGLHHDSLTPWMVVGHGVVEGHGDVLLHGAEDHVNWLWNAGHHVRVDDPGRRGVEARGYVAHCHLG